MVQLRQMVFNINPNPHIQALRQPFQPPKGEHLPPSLPRRLLRSSWCVLALTFPNTVLFTKYGASNFMDDKLFVNHSQILRESMGKGHNQNVYTIYAQSGCTGTRSLEVTHKP